MYTSETQIRVRYSETDQMNVVYYGNYAQYFEVGRVEAMRSLGLSYKELEATGIIMPVVEFKARFLRPARYDDLLTVRTTVKEWPTAHHITFLQEVYNEKGKLLTSGYVVNYFVVAVTMEKTNVPGEMQERLKPFFTPGAQPKLAGDQPASL